MASLIGQLSPAAISCTLEPPFTSMWELISSSDGTTARSVSGFQLSKVEIAREDLPARPVVEIDDVTPGMGFDLHCLLSNPSSPSDFRRANRF